jgi:hypothetical protein
LTEPSPNSTVSEKIPPMPAAVRAGVTLTRTAVRTMAPTRRPASSRTARRSSELAFTGAVEMAGTNRKRFHPPSAATAATMATLAMSTLP